MAEAGDQPCKGAGWLCFLGPPDAAFGGGAWTNFRSGDAFPTLMDDCAAPFDADALDLLTGRDGWDAENGYLKLTPVLTV